jgi:hypothetical protein
VAVVQQARGRVKPTLQMAGGLAVNDDAGLEREADVMGWKATQINCTRHLRPDSALPLNLAVRNNSSILLQRVIIGDSKDKDNKPIPIKSLDVFKLTGETPESQIILRKLDDDKGKQYSIYDALEIARKQSVLKPMVVPSVVATNSAAAPLASAVPPPAIPDEKPRKPIVITIAGSSAHGDNNHQKQSEAARPKPPTPKDQVNAIIRDMKKQFNNWDGSLKNRGAWWGSQKPGEKNGAKNVPKELIKELEKQAPSGWWLEISHSTDGLAFHKKLSDQYPAFIYHLRSPVS